MKIYQRVGVKGTRSWKNRGTLRLGPRCRLPCTECCGERSRLQPQIKSDRITIQAAVLVQDVVSNVRNVVENGLVFNLTEKR